MANRRTYQFYNTFHARPVQLDCNFVVDQANGNGLGIRNLKGPGIANVYMHTDHATSNGNPNWVAGNPNPQVGVILVQFQDSYARYFGGFSGFVVPVSGSPLAVTATGANLSVGNVYIIVATGTTSAAEWVTLGVPVGVTPAVGVSFVAAATGAGAGTGFVEVPASGASGLANNIQVIGDPNTTVISNTYPYMTVGCYGATNSSTTTQVLTAPAAGSVIGMTFVMSNSSLLVQGE